MISNIAVKNNSELTEKDCKVLGSRIKELSSFAENINNRSRGKRKLPLIVIWGLYLIVFGTGLGLVVLAIKNVPFLRPIDNIVTAISITISDVITGLWHDKRDATLDHLDKTQTVDNKEFGQKLQKKLAVRKIEKCDDCKI